MQVTDNGELISESFVRVEFKHSSFCLYIYGAKNIPNMCLHFFSHLCFPFVHLLLSPASVSHCNNAAWLNSCIYSIHAINTQQRIQCNDSYAVRGKERPHIHRAEMEKSPLEKQALIMKLKLMVDTANTSRKTNTSVGSLLVNTAPLGLTWRRQHLTLHYIRLFGKTREQMGIVRI